MLARALSRPLGLFEPVALSLDELPPERGQAMEARLAALDPGGRLARARTASRRRWRGWSRDRSSPRRPPSAASICFYDPSRGAGLSQPGGVASLGNTLGLMLDTTGGVRALFTGTHFNMTGRPSTEWLLAPENDVGLPAFHAAAGSRHRRRAARAPGDARWRGRCWRWAATLAVLEDAGEPAHVRNDFRARYLGNGRAEPVRSAGRRSSGSSPRPTAAWACPPRSRRSGGRR